jgi:murein DD-endopeptidase MepM/ murein hydrolase activator NlpD
MKKSLVLVITLIILIFTSSITYGNELKNTKNKLDEMKDSINEKKEKVEALENEKESVEAQIERLDSQMNITNAELDSIEGKIKLVDEEIVSLSNEIEEKETELQIETKLMEERLNALYKRGSAGYFSVILGSNDFSQLFDRIVAVKRIIDYDKNIIRQVQEQKYVIEARKAEMNQKKLELKVMKTESDEKLNQFKNQSSEKSILVKSIEADKVKYEKLVAQEEADAKVLQEKIKKLEQQFKSNNSKTVSITGTKYRISSYYGYRIHPVLGTKRFHAGIDIAVPMGTSIYSLKDGIVIFSGVMSGYGNVIMVNHGDITSLYAHNSSLKVKEGQVVKSGQLIAYSGNSGLSTGPHLHFEIRNKNGDTIDPISYYK